MNSSKFFENKDCKYYPCHKLKEINCLFCYCPIYHNCEIRKCDVCTFPHLRKNYDDIISMLRTGTNITLGEH